MKHCIEHSLKPRKASTYVILENSPGWELPSQPIDPDILADIARRWFESGRPIIENGPPTTLVNLAVGFALSPYLQKAAEILLPLIDMNEWQRSFCPICGGIPVFAVLDREGGGRSLFCPRCHGLWAYRRTTCPFCERDEDVIYYPSEDQVYRLYVCRSCNRYIKTIDLRRTEREAILPVERILTVSMDLGAQQAGHIHF
jgi:formate dehydrogenase maturation protein FdhE